MTLPELTIRTGPLRNFECIYKYEPVASFSRMERQLVEQYMGLKLIDRRRDGKNALLIQLNRSVKFIVRNRAHYQIVFMQHSSTTVADHKIEPLGRGAVEVHDAQGIIVQQPLVEIVTRYNGTGGIPQTTLFNQRPFLGLFTRGSRIKSAAEIGIGPAS